MPDNIRVRFAPSPTGPLHIGGVRTALYNYLFARRYKGKFILRIEDTDQSRYVPGTEEYILESLNWLGIMYDEGPDIGGKFSPYRQSERRSIYRQYAECLVSTGNAYYAFDTAEELETLREKLKHEHSDFQKYDFISRKEMKNSLTLSADEVKRRLSSGEHYVIRLKIPENTEISIQDEIRGLVIVNSNQLDDKILFKSDGWPTYHLANVVDDHLMEITHVIRGEEWLPSAPVHVLLYEFLGWKATMPKFAHLPLILKPEGNGKLSKRDGDRLGFPVFPLEWKDPLTGEISSGYRESGYLPEAVVNIVAMLGWNPGTEQEIFSLEELTAHFSLDRVIKSGAKFNPQKAHWFNHHYLKIKNNEQLAEMLIPVLGDHHIQADKNYITQVCNLVKEKISFISDFWNYSSYFFTEPDKFDEEIIRKKWNNESIEFFNTFLSKIGSVEEFSHAEIEKVFNAVAEGKNLKPGNFMQLFRVIISGVGAGPHIFDIAAILGKDKVTSRINNALLSFNFLT